MDNASRVHPMQAKASCCPPNDFTVYPAIFMRYGAQMVRSEANQWSIEGKTVAKVNGYAFAKALSSLMKRE